MFDNSPEQGRIVQQNTKSKSCKGKIVQLERLERVQIIRVFLPESLLFANPASSTTNFHESHWLHLLCQLIVASKLSSKSANLSSPSREKLQAPQTKINLESTFRIWTIEKSAEQVYELIGKRGAKFCQQCFGWPALARSFNQGVDLKLILTIFGSLSSAKNRLWGVERETLISKMFPSSSSA